jgi:hypothetical protein
MGTKIFLRWYPAVYYDKTTVSPLNNSEDAMNRLFHLLCTLTFVCIASLHTPLTTEEALPGVYSQISDIYHPSLDDYQILQQFLSNGKRDLSELKDTEWVTRNIAIIDPLKQEKIESGLVPLRCAPDDKENCILLYASFNRNYPNALRRLLKAISESDYEGHVLYRIGGWPNTEGGDLSLAHVPYSFKICMFREAQRLGFKRCLWLDTAFLPIASLREVFSMIQSKGYLMVGLKIPIKPYMNAKAAAAFGLTLEQTAPIFSCSAGIAALDLTSEKGSKILELWYKAARDPAAFFSARSDQNALSIILHQLNITDLISISRIPHVEIGEQPQADSLFLLDRLYAHRPR